MPYATPVLVTEPLPPPPMTSGEAREIPVTPYPNQDPEQRYAEPTWRSEPTSELDPRKGR